MQLATVDEERGALTVVTGIVQRGDQRGRQLGFPTANLPVPAGSGLLDGVFAGFFERSSGETTLAAISVGRRPTFYEAQAVRLVEAHLIDFDGDLYGEAVRVELRTWIRAQRRFPSVGALTRQLRRDIDLTRSLLAGQAGERR